MKALIKKNKEKGFALEEVKIPKVKPGNLLVKIKSASICGTDIHLYNSSNMINTWNIKLPLLIGHEISGEIIEIGSNTENSSFNFKTGDRIAVDSHLHCKVCSQCVNNKKHNCDDVKVLGVHESGAFAEYVNLPVEIAYKIPDEISNDEGSMLEPFGVSVKSFTLAAPLLFDKVAVFGGGPIGLMLAKLCHASGIKNTFLFETSKYRRDLAKKLGITNCYNPLKNDLSIDFNKYFNVIFEVSGNAGALQTALKYIGKNGKVIVIGIYPDEISLDIKNNIMSKEVSMIGTFGRLMWETWSEMMEILKNNQMNLNEFITHQFKFDDFKEAFEIANSGNCGKVILHF